MTLTCGICKKDFILHEDSKETVLICPKCGREHKVDFENKLSMSELICGCGSHVYFEGKGSYIFYPDDKRYNNIMQNKANDEQKKKQK